MGRSHDKRKRRRTRRRAAREAELEQARADFVDAAKQLKDAEANLRQARVRFKKEAIFAYQLGAMSQHEMSRISGRAQSAINRWIRGRE